MRAPVRETVEPLDNVEINGKLKEDTVSVAKLIKLVPVVATENAPTLISNVPPPRGPFQDCPPPIGCSGVAA